MRAALTALISDRPGAILHLDDVGVGLAGRGLGPGRTVFAPHNVEHRIVREVAATRPLSHRSFLEVEWRKIAAEERLLWRGSDLCVAVSELDAAAMRAGGARRVEVCPNGTDPHPPLPPAAAARGVALRLLFVGSGAFWPYERGLQWFAQEVMPRLQAGGGATLDVVGERPPSPHRGPGIRYHGRVPDVRPFYERAHALVVPVFEGSGTRLKIIEAATLGRPVISTALGAEGLPVRERWLARLSQTSPGRGSWRRWRSAIRSSSPAVDDNA
jgi:glycosyltransferase involved in cell wall biosynthesis